MRAAGEHRSDPGPRGGYDSFGEVPDIYYLAKFAGIFGPTVQDVGAQQTGMTVEAFKEKLRKQGE